jgi:hypothetical protein
MADRIFVALTFVISILLMGVLGGTVNAVTLQHVEEQRLQGVTAQLRARLEIDLRVGLALADNDRAQAMLEDAVAHTSMLESLEIDSDQGTVLFSSDRALRGEFTPLSWRDAMRASPGGWHVITRGEHSLATPLRDAAGQIAGYLVLTHQAEPDEDAVTLPTPVLWVATVVGLLAVLAGWLVEKRSRKLDPTEEKLLQDVGSVIGEARSELTRVNNEAHRLAGLEP